MLKNKDFRRVLVIGSAVTVIFAVCGFIFAKAAAGALILVTGAILIALFSHYTKETGRRRAVYSEVKYL